MSVLGKDEVVARLGTLATALPETAKACELMASSLQSRYGTVLGIDARASIDALSSTRPDLPGWDDIRTILAIEGENENFTLDNDYSQRDASGMLYDLEGNPNPGGLW